MLRFLKEWTLPVAIALGTILYLLFAYIPLLEPAGEVMGGVMDWLFPMSVFFTLFVTFTKLDFHKMRPANWHVHLIAAQLLLTALLVALILLLDLQGAARIIAEAALVCVIAPCASASSVVTGKLGGDINQMATFTLISSLLCAVTIPTAFPLLEKAAHVSFATASALILQRIALVMLLPLALGWAVRHLWRRLYQFIVRHPNLGFYTWGFSLAITTGVTVRNICHSGLSLPLLLLIALVSFLACLVQFQLGRSIGRVVGERVCTRQGMFQKNTAMTILMATLYLSGAASIGAGCYVIWQNIINSYELWHHQHRG